mgnify:CR=1 FL=1
MTTLAVELSGITKRFPGVVANDDVNLRVAEGEIHAVVGENGAGKSTLMKILYGMQSADEGRMLVGGTEVDFSSPSEAIEHGIGMVHQHFMLADNLTVLENVVLGAEPRRRGLIDRRTARRDLKALGASYGLDLHPDDPVETLEVGERQRVEITNVPYRGARVLILDEPTAVLVPQEVEELFRNLRGLKARGHTIIFIDHKLEEVRPSPTPSRCSGKVAPSPLSTPPRSPPTNWRSSWSVPNYRHRRPSPGAPTTTSP